MARSLTFKAATPSPAKRKREAEDVESPAKKTKQADNVPTPKNTLSLAQASQSVAPSKASFAKDHPRRDQPFEEPFKYLPSSTDSLDTIFKFYSVDSRFPRDRFLVRNAQGTATKNIYYTTALARDILTENEGKGMKFVHAGVKMFVKQDAPNPEVCPWRIQTDGLRIIETWVGQETGS